MTDPIQRDYDLASELMSEGRFDQVSEVLERMRRHDESDPRTIEIAGDLASNQGDLDEAEAWYRKLDAFEEDPEVRGLGRLGLGHLRLEQSDPKAASARFLEASYLFEAAGSIDRLVLALVGLGQARLDLGELEEAVQAYQGILSVVEDREIPSELSGIAAGVCQELANTLRLLGELDEAEARFQDAIQRFETIDNIAGIAECLDGLGIIAQVQGRYDEGEALHLNALEINETIDYDEGMSANYGNLTMLNLHRKDLDRAEQYARKALEIDRKLEHPNGVAHFYNLLGQIESNRGNFEAAEHALANAEKLYRTCGDREDVASISSQFGVLYRRWGRLDEAEAKALETLDMAEAMGHSDGIAATYDELALIRKAQGRPDEARSLWNTALALYENLQSRRMIEEVREHLRDLDAEAP